jgi:glycosyltransferase involved in cell wall biosynthesis
MPFPTASRPARVSAVVPAHDEETTIGGVVELLVGHPLIDEVIVVDDACTDRTAAVARAAGARVLSMPENGGKAKAMSLGVESARNGVIFFSDADLTGLTSEKVARVVMPVASGEFGMFVGIRDRKWCWVRQLLPFLPVLGGERALARDLWDQVPSTYKRHFQIEIALNFFARRNGCRTGCTVLTGVGHVIKERKRGLLRGLWQRLSMVGDILLVSLRLYVLAQDRAAHAAIAEPGVRGP